MKENKLSVMAKARVMAEASDNAVWTRLLDFNTESSIKMAKLQIGDEPAVYYAVSFHPSGDHSWVPLQAVIDWCKVNMPEALGEKPARKVKAE